MPAVSASRRGTPATMTVSSTTSRVVPAYWVTMERWHPESRFIKVDFPALGRPAITVTRPSRYMRPLSKPWSSSSKAASPWRMPSKSAASSTWGTSSSGKSAQAARWAACSNSPCLMDSIFRDSTPVLPAKAAFRACSPLAEIRPITASAWAKSIFPLRKARRVNSPGPAGAAPASSTSWSRRFVMYSPPWQESSTTSSPV